MPTPQYGKPPITEAVIDLHFSASVSLSDLDRFRRRLAKQFPGANDRNRFEIKIGPESTAPVNEKVGYQLNSQDGANIIIVEKSTITTCRLAPYCGWDSMFAAAQENYSHLEASVGYRSLKRVGTKFMNRIDIPSKTISGRPISDFIKFGVAVPSQISSSVALYNINIEAPDPSGAKMLINSGLQPSALLDAASFSLDIDVLFEYSNPITITEAWAKFTELRTIKNRVFEEAITDEARAIFNG